MKYYCLGIKGSGMSSLACILSDLGNKVSGYDDSKGYKYTMDGLVKRKIDIFNEPHDIDSDTIVTYSKAFSFDHPELKRVKKLGLTIKEYGNVMGDLTKKYKSICVSGTHGKTTTTFLISEIFNNTVGCNCFVGDGTGYASKDNEYFVLESDEFNRHFLEYYPNVAIITNIELDHTECYPGGIEEIKEAFKTFANKADLIIANGDDENVRSIKFDKKVIYYGFGNNNDVIAKNYSFGEKGSKFECYMYGKKYGTFNTKLIGNHMIHNILSASIAANYYGIELNEIKKNVAKFKGAKRRFKIKKVGDYITIDDYAHHPTEIAVTIKTARQKYPDKEIIAVFLPNTYSRTKALMNEFIDALSIADKSYIMDIHCDRENQNDYQGISSDVLIEKIPGADKVSVDTANKLLKHKNSVICFMSCTNIYEIENEFFKLAKN